MDPFVGEIRLFAGNYAPEGWQICSGQLLPISQYELLYALVGTIYGGDGRSTFGIPDLRGRVVVNQGQRTGSTNNYALGATAGVEEVTLTSANLPSHNHTFSVSQVDATETVPTNNFLAVPQDTSTANRNIGVYVPSTAPGLTEQSMLPTALSAVGGNMPHENRMPFIALNYIIATNGIFPQ